MPMPLPEIGTPGLCGLARVTAASAIICGTPMKGRLSWVKVFMRRFAQIERTPGCVCTLASCAAFIGAIIIGKACSAIPLAIPIDFNWLNSAVEGRDSYVMTAGAAAPAFALKNLVSIGSTLAPAIVAVSAAAVFNWAVLRSGG